VRSIKRTTCLDLEEVDLPQDGKMRLFDSQEDPCETVDVRVAVGPTMFGESVTLRILQKARVLEALTHPEKLLQNAVREQVLELGKKSHGLIVVTGPTGCGKTSTLLGLLHQLDREHLKVVCIEDPAEVLLDGVHQIQVRPDKGLSFAAALRHCLRLDPDVIYCSEVRDFETVTLLVQAAATGHLVLASLHASTAPEAVLRLMDVGVKAPILAQVLLGVVGQRLIRRLDPDTTRPSLEDLETLRGFRSEPLPEGAQALVPGELPEGATGYNGRLPIQELLRMTPELRKLFQDRPTHEEMIAQARKDGYRTMKENAVERVLAGETSVREVLCVCPS
jgi:general secretion pathway protein E